MTAMKGQQIFLLDMMLDVLMLLLALRFAGRRPRPVRVLAAALLGALAARLTVGMPQGARAALWLPTAAAMTAAADGGRGIRGILRGSGLLLASAGLLGGMVQALLGATGSRGAALLLGAGVALCTAAAAFRARRSGLSMHTVRVVCRYRDRQATFEAMVDTGNCLRDYLTQRPVIVLPEERGRVCLALEEAALRPIFADTAGGRQMMWCLKPDTTRILEGGTEREVKAVLALSPGLGKDAPALLPAALLDEGT